MALSKLVIAALLAACLTGCDRIQMKALDWRLQDLVIAPVKAFAHERGGEGDATSEDEGRGKRG